MGSSEELVINGGKSSINETLNNYIRNHRKISISDSSDINYIFDRTICNKMLQDNVDKYNSSLFNFALWRLQTESNNNHNIIENGFIFMFA